MRARFAIWEHGPAIYFDDSCLPELESLGVGISGGHALVLHHSSGLLKVLPSVDGVHITSSSLSDRDRWPYIIRWLSDEPPDDVRCGVMDVTLTKNRSDGWRATLPLNHDLPWPLYKELEDGPFDKHVAAVREIRLRLKSAGAARIIIPVHVMDLLTREERVGLFTNWKI